MLEALLRFEASAMISNYQQKHCRGQNKGYIQIFMTTRFPISITKAHGCLLSSNFQRLFSARQNDAIAGTVIFTLS
jgi:hypothetical protein